MAGILLKSMQILILPTTLQMLQHCATPLQDQPQRRDRIKHRIRGTNVKPWCSTECPRGGFFLALSRDSISVKHSIQFRDLHSPALGPTLDKVPMPSAFTVTGLGILPITVNTQSSYNIDNPIQQHLRKHEIRTEQFKYI